MSEPVFEIHGPIEDAYESDLEKEIAIADEIYFCRMNKCRPNWNRIYSENPSEVVYVPPRREIKSALLDLLKKTEKEVPKDLENMTYPQMYAIYFKLMGVEKYDPKKHNNQS